jgi:hypothetical protein
MQVAQEMDALPYDLASTLTCCGPQTNRLLPITGHAMQVAQRVDVLLCDLASALLPAAEGQVDVLVRHALLHLLLLFEVVACQTAGDVLVRPCTLCALDQLQ